MVVGIIHPHAQCVSGKLLAAVPDEQQQQLRSAIICIYLRCFQKPAINMGKISKHATLPPSIVSDAKGHYPEEMETQLRCVYAMQKPAGDVRSVCTLCA